jgi:hypothetical protein
MSKEDRCRNGTPNCEFDNEHELELVSELMRVIGSYNRKEDIDACPRCLRNTMLAVAALLHLDAARIESERAGKPRAGTKYMGNALAKAARQALEDVTEAKATMAGSQSKH